MTWKDILISPHTQIIKALEIIDAGAMRFAIVVDEKYRLVGTLTDGDIRRGILRGVSLDSSVSEVMNVDPISFSIHDDKQKIISVMKRKKLQQIPILDDDGCVVSLELLTDILESDKRENWVILMAGGLGSRLSPLTDDCPKPLLKVGSKPILENIIDNFISQGFYKFYLSVNYKAEMIKEYFGDGTKWGIEIQYIHETRKLGTAGALSLIPEEPKEPVIIMNGDLLTKVNYNHLLDFHKENNSMATMCVREYEFQVPYGVVNVDNHRMLGIVEKPVQKFFVNGGIYVLEPKAIEFIPKNTYYDMPTLFETLIKENYESAVFPIREYWVDIGRMDDFRKANEEFKEGFL